MRRLARPALAANTAASSLRELGFDGLARLCREATGAHAPQPRVRHEPREGFGIIDSETRAARLGLASSLCVVCDNLTCPAVDIVERDADELAYLTPNLYPIVFPFEERDAAARGIHLVHWSCRDHAGGWAGADAASAAALLDQLADAEEFLLHEATDDYPDTGDGHRGYVSTIKNRGRRVGGSVEHDHQQILLSALAPSEPPKTRALLVASAMPREPALELEQIDGLARSFVPAFARRPLQAFVAPRSTGVGHLHHMPAEERAACALALARLFSVVDSLMTQRHGEPAWNMICHTGAGLGPLFELRAFTQPLGGYEHLGLYLSEEPPERSAAELRDALAAL